MKKIRIVLVILICVFIVYAIMSGDESTVSDNFLNDDDNKNDRCLDYELVVVEDFIEVSEDLTIDFSDHVVTDSYIFFILNYTGLEAKFGDYSDLMIYDIENNDVEFLCRIEKEDSKVWVNELVKINDYLVYQVTSPEGFEFCFYNLSSGEEGVVYSYSRYEQPYLGYRLKGNDRYLLWYEVGVSESGDEVWNYVIFDMLEMTVDRINSVFVTSPYRKPNVKDDCIVYIKLKEGEYKIFVMNLSTQSVKEFDIGNQVLDIKNLIANEDYIVWNESSDEMYVIDVKKDELEKLVLGDIPTYIFSFEMIDNTLIINGRGDDCLITFNLDTNEVYYIEDSLTLAGDRVYDKIYSAVYLTQDSKGYFYFTVK
ncbi:MAG: hypothetical protein MJB12_17475 [Firmicutes bacterium]|nr:hypothetical protein [Bacillota bacterium]